MVYDACDELVEIGVDQAKAEMKSNLDIWCEIYIKRHIFIDYLGIIQPNQGYSLEDIQLNVSL